MEDEITLRPFSERDLSFLDRLGEDPRALGPYEWPGYADPGAGRRRFERDGYIAADNAALAVVCRGAVGGIASWQAKDRGGPAGGCLEIGLALLPEHRGCGLGTAAHRLLVNHLFEFTLAHRLEAQTDAANLPEQAVLARLGFTQEGVLRGVRFRHGNWRDMVIYGLLSPDYQAAAGR
jgi:ribosomal-protein-alanine N-acetyltransferase